ncbi:MAG: hypothetical protein ACI3XA_02285 [Clostridia bacterium]
MLKERLKTILIVVLLASCVLLTYETWFKSSVTGENLFRFEISDLPIVRLFTGEKNTVSVPKENLSKPRKLVVNDGSLWVPYYNTDEAFDNLNEKISAILKSCLSGHSAKVTQITYKEWLANLDKPSVYVEYPIAVTPEMLANILNTTSKDMPFGLNIVRDGIIIPEGEKGVCVAIRDSISSKAWQFYIEDEFLAFPEAVLALFTKQNSRDGYYEFAYSTLIGDGIGEGGVTVEDLVLFSDNDANIRDIYAHNPLSGADYGNLLKSFSFNPSPIRRYSDEYGGENYVENYATVRIYPDGYIEYSSVKEGKGIDLVQKDGNGYEILNSAIDFAEKLWNSISKEPLNVLVSGVEETETGSKITFDYYCGGREVAVAYDKEGREPLYHAIEISVQNGQITSYRQYLRYYEEAVTYTGQESFITALDYYVDLFKSEKNAIITDMYPGYFDGGEEGLIKITWLCEYNYGDERYPKRSVSDNLWQ